MLLFSVDLRYLFVIMDQNDIPVDTGRKLNVHKMSGRLPNVLCTFNLRILSTGIANYADDKTPYVSLLNVKLLVKSPEEASRLILIWFSDDPFRGKASKRHLLLILISKCM